MKALPPDFLDVLRLPVLHEDDLDTQAGFFDRDAVSDFYRATVQEGTGDEVLQTAAALLPELHPLRAALFAILCGGLVENGADPRLLFPAALRRLAQLLASLAPYGAAEPMEDDEGKKRPRRNRPMSSPGAPPRPRSRRCRRPSACRSKRVDRRLICWCCR